MARSTSGSAAADRLARLPLAIEARGVRHNNLRDLDVDIPLWCVVAVAGVSGSGKSSLAMGTLFAEGMQRFLEGLSTYSRRRLSQAQRPDADRIDHLPAALALRQRPPVPGVRSTVGTMSEVLNVLRLIMSRLGTHICPNGHPVAPTVSTQGEEMTCPVCGVRFTHPGAESFAFNSYGACPACNGTGELFQVDVDALVPDEDKSIDDGAVLPWNAGGRRLYRYAAGQLGVRLDVPFRELTARERDIVFHGEPVERDVTLREGTPRAITLNVHYENAVATVEHAAASDNPSGRKQVERFLKVGTCPVCHGTRLNPEALRSTLDGRNLAQISALNLDGAARLRREGAATDAEGTRPGVERPGEGVPAGARPAAPAGPRLPAARPGRQHAVDRGAAAPRADLDRPRQHDRHALRARRAVGRPAPEQHRGAALHHRDARRQRQLGGDGRARDRDHQRRRLGDRARPRARASYGGTVIAQGTPADIRASERLDHRPVPGGAAGRPPRAPADRRRGGHGRGRRPVQPARRPRVVPRAAR